MSASSVMDHIPTCDKGLTSLVCASIGLSLTHTHAHTHNSQVISSPILQGYERIRVYKANGSADGWRNGSVI